MDNTYISVIEALIFSSDDSLSAEEIIRAVKSIDGEEIELNKNDVDSTVDLLNQKYIENGNAFQYVQHSSGRAGIPAPCIREYQPQRGNSKHNKCPYQPHPVGVLKCEGYRLEKITCSNRNILSWLPHNEVSIYGKGKRQVLKSIAGRVRGRFDVVVAEVGDNDIWQLATVGICTISNDKRHTNEVLSKMVNFIINGGFDAVTGYGVKFGHLHQRQGLAVRERA